MRSDLWRTKTLRIESPCATGKQTIYHIECSGAATLREMAHLRETEDPSLGASGNREEDRDGHESRRG